MSDRALGSHHVAYRGAGQRRKPIDPALPARVQTDRAPIYPRVIDKLTPGARHVVQQYANKRVEADHSRLEARLRPMRGLKPIQFARIVAAGHAFVPNLRRGHHELTSEIPLQDPVRAAFTELAACLRNLPIQGPGTDCQPAAPNQRNTPVDRIIDVFKMALLPAIEQLAGSAAPACW